MQRALAVAQGIRIAGQFIDETSVAPPTRHPVWALGNGPRGEETEVALGQTLCKPFPVIDRWRNNVATSIKSADIDTKSWQDIRTAERTLKKCINDLANFNQVDFDGVVIRPGDIHSKVLRFAIPHPGNSEQRAFFESMKQYASSLGVTLEIRVY